ncbi:MAG: TetR/AcrR family transcriptional regulator [Desulfobacterales bacterium]|nr:TetR/AcrR family transcriptional regulator [Desulfobacterales bacterium]MDD4073560.1 TetR/AcrR family transcriptional regulator [Desulfobacterales bacterium]MDD4392026.1 TetR/AcrR family transcriptional regulator [Desulfobacterales bacterium]
MRAQKTETEARQSQIIGAALELIGAEGVNALSIAGIAERVGIVPSALYRHFKSKDDVLDAVLELLKVRLLGNVTQVRKETPGALPRLKSLLMRHARMLSENRAIPLVVFSDGIYTGHPERKAKVAAIITSYLSKIQKIVEEGIQDGSIRENVVSTAASVMFLGMILPAAVLWNVSEGNFDMNAHVENAWPAFVRCIAKNT